MPSPQPAIAALLPLLESGDEADRCHAARALGVLGDESVVAALVVRLRDEDIDVCIDAAEALGRIGSRRAVPPLIEALAHESNGEIGVALVRALGAIGGEAARDRLLEVATERPGQLEQEDDWDSWWDLQLEAVRALGRAGDMRVAAVLVEIMEHPGHQDIESEALQVLAQLGGRAAEVLVQRLRHRSPRSRRRAARALAAVRSAAAVRALGRALQDRAAEVRSAAVDALAEQGAAHYLPAILLLMQDEDEAVRSAAIRGACRLSDPAVRELRQRLLARLDDPGGTVRRNALEALSGAVGEGPLPAAAMEKVVAGLDDPDPTTGCAASALLGRCGDPSAIPPLCALLADEDRDPMLRRAAAQALGAIGVVDDDLLRVMAETLAGREQAVSLAVLSALVDLAAGEAEGDNRPLGIVIGALAGAGHPPVSGEERKEGDAVERGAVAAEAPAAGSPASTLEAIAMDGPVQGRGDGEAEPVDEEALRYWEMAERQRRRAERPPAPATALRRVVGQGVATPPPPRTLLSGGWLPGPLPPTPRAEAVAALADIVRHEPDAALVGEAMAALGQIATRAPSTPGLAPCRDLLMAQLERGGRDARLASIHALGRLGGCAAIAPLLAVLDDQAVELRIAAANAVTELAMREMAPDQGGLERAVAVAMAERFLASLEDPAGGVRLAVAKGLERLLKHEELRGVTGRAVEQMIAAALRDAGQQARPLGRVIRAVQAGLGVERLLARLTLAEESADRRPLIEMLEEQFRATRL